MTPAAVLVVLGVILQERAKSALMSSSAPASSRSPSDIGARPHLLPFAAFRSSPTASLNSAVQEGVRSFSTRTAPVQAKPLGEASEAVSPRAPFRPSGSLSGSSRVGSLSPPASGRSVQQSSFAIRSYGSKPPSPPVGFRSAFNPVSSDVPAVASSSVPKELRNYWRSKFDDNYPRNWGRTPFAERQLDQCPSSNSADIRKALLEIIQFTISGERLWLQEFIEERLPLLEIAPAMVKPLFKRFLLAVRPELQFKSYKSSWEEVWNIPSLKADYSGYTDDARGGSWLCAEKLCIVHRLLGWAESEIAAAAKGTTTIPAHLYPTIYRLARLGEATDARQYVNRFPAARAVKRKIKLHVGPTNSGKTYNALLALVKARSGFYAGPLRLLAHEVWSRINRGTMAGMNEVGRDCNLLTGEEVRVVDEECQLASCTVEMIGLNTAPVDVGVVDEIQLLGDPNRGGVWNSTVLGACAHELHLCGEDTVVDLVKRIAAETGDEVEVNHHTRLAPLAVAEDSLDGDWSKVRKGDCVIAFGRKTVHQIKDEIQAKTPLKCVVAYGGLPPETRAEQAKLFNDPDSGYDVLVATDAVGMGLNLWVLS